MKNIKWSKEIVKLILLIVIAVAFFILGYVIIPNKYYSLSLLGVSGASIGLSLFQLKRVIDFARNPKKYNKEQIEVKDERNNRILINAKSSSFDIETFVILGITVYSIYLNNVGFVIAILALWISRIFSFFYYLSKNNKKI
ncbi:hypothetical protein [Clostridium vincentii]|uniref:Uncharacterized protein n=1 Tax=Clostridium vincentii TaxID=52704 RepID=A0A2T0BFA4_9CLOT|nr:hypothetical protein [Clostridium vincentii]PRR82502.1 hypothetical protein CLVI_16370 [Clostridium vincentii]